MTGNTRPLLQTDGPSALRSTQTLAVTPGQDMSREVATVSLLVREYDEAIRFFTEALRFDLVEDSPQSPGKRWVVVSPGQRTGVSLLLAKASSSEQMACVGNQAGGRVFLFLHTSDFQSDYAHMKAHGVKFLEEPRDEAYGRVVVFQDLYGNKWDLLHRADC